MSKSIAEDPRIGKTHNRALCCECGTLRLVSENYVAGVGTGNDPRPRSFRIGHIERRGFKPFERWLGRLKCVTCKATTNHAKLIDCDPHGFRDRAEVEQRRRQADEAADWGSLRKLATVECVAFDGDDSKDDIVLFMVEQTKFDQSWRVSFNERLPGEIAVRGIELVIEIIERATLFGKIIDWDENKSARSVTYVIRGELLDEFRIWQKYGLLAEQLEAAS